MYVVQAWVLNKANSVWVFFLRFLPSYFLWKAVQKQRATRERKSLQNLEKYSEKKGMWNKLSTLSLLAGHPSKYKCLENNFYSFVRGNVLTSNLNSWTAHYSKFYVQPDSKREVQWCATASLHAISRSLDAGASSWLKRTKQRGKHEFFLNWVHFHGRTQNDTMTCRMELWSSHKSTAALGCDGCRTSNTPKNLQ